MLLHAGTPLMIGTRMSSIRTYRIVKEDGNLLKWSNKKYPKEISTPIKNKLDYVMKHSLPTIINKLRLRKLVSMSSQLNIGS